MIKKINKIINIGSFMSFDWDLFNPTNKIDKNGNIINDAKGNPKIIDSSFNKYNILYGENGSGKSTLVKIFKAINTNNDNYLNKHWDLTNKDREIALNMDSINIKYDENNKWQNNNMVKNIIIFDREYVNDYIHTGKERTSQQDRNTGHLILYLGDFYVYKYFLEKTVDVLKSINKKQDDYKSNFNIQKQILEKDIKNPDLVYKYYNSVKIFQKDKFDKIKIMLNKHKENKEKEFNILKNSGEIINLKNKFQLIEYSNKIKPEQGNALFEFSVTRGIIETRKQIEGKQTFIEQGTKLVFEKDLEKCPYCEQDIKDKNGEYYKVIKEYESIFNDEFLKTQKNTEINLESYKQSLQFVLNFQVPKSNSDFLNQFNRLFESNEIFENYKLTADEKKAINNELRNIDNKSKNILNAFISENTDNLKIIFNNFEKFIINYNNKVNELNQIIAKKQIEFHDLNIRNKINYIEKVNLVIKDLIYSIDNIKELEFITLHEKLIYRNDKTIEQIMMIITLFREKINNEFDRFVSNYLSTIKKYIDLLYPAFELVQIEKNRVTYDFRSNDVFCGFNVIYKDNDRFKDLSEGEKQIIALAYFFASLESEIHKNEKIVVFDDPITSFDSGKRKQTVELILNNTNEFKQVFIMTCDSLFKRYSQKIIPSQKSYYILKASSSSIFYTPKDAESIYNSFKKDLNEIDKALGTDEDIVEYGQRLRFCIEEIRETYLGHNTDNLSQVLNHVNKVNFVEFKNKIPDLLTIYNYCNTGGLAHFPKDGSTSWVELKHQVKKYLSLSL